MRVKTPGSFWKLAFADTAIYPGAQLLRERWANLADNWTRPLREDFQATAGAVRPPRPKGTIQIIGLPPQNRNQGFPENRPSSAAPSVASARLSSQPARTSSRRSNLGT